MTDSHPPDRGAPRRSGRPARTAAALSRTAAALSRRRPAAGSARPRRARTAASGAPPILALLAGLLAAGPAAGPAAAATGPAGPVPDARPGTARTVTLITGDRVTMIGDATAVTPAAGREKVGFHTSEVAGRLRVVPGDALPLLRQGRLDPRLFDVTTLLEYGYDRRDALPVIVTHAGGAAARTARTRVAGDGEVTRELPAVDGLAVTVPRRGAPAFWTGLTGGTGARTLAAGVTKIWLDGRARPSLDVSVRQIGAPAAWEKGYTGTGVKVAVLDTGIDAAHPDLAGKVAARADFTEEPDERDTVGHGTHVASTIAGSGAASGGRYRGVAPGATLLDGKVCGEGYCAESSIIAGMQWAAEQGAAVANLSLGGEDAPGEDPLEEAVRTLTARYGTLFVAAAGNYGGPATVGSPSTADDALAVGAVSKSGELAPFSSRGPRAGDDGLKPDITAPGVDITAARSGDSPGTGAYIARSGTSMATPHVSGAAAILAGLHPDWPAARLKATLMATARPAAAEVYAQGAGLVDVAGAIGQAVTADPPSLSFGRQAWPHGDDEPVTRRLTYRNAGAAAVTLRLSVRAVDGDGRPLPDELFTVDPPAVTVPAGGTAGVTVTADTRAAVPDGRLGGHLIAAGDGGVAVSVPLGVHKEVESYDLTLEHVGRDGAAAAEFETTVLRTDVAYEEASVRWVLPGEPATLRLPRGRYTIDGRILDEAGVAMMVHPRLELTSSQTLRVDARLARPLAIGAPDPAAEPLMAEVTHSGAFQDGARYGIGFLGPDPARMSTAQLGPDQGHEGLVTKVAGQWAADGGDAYRLTWFVPGRVPTGFTRRVRRPELAEIRTDYARQMAADGVTGEAASGAYPPTGRFRAYLAPTTFPLPSVRTEYVNTDGGIHWRRYFWEVAPSGENNTGVSAVNRYEPGRRVTERWNRGAFGPALPDAELAAGVTRTGDVLAVGVPLYGDGAGRMGLSTRATGSIALYRDGSPLAERPDPYYNEFELPAAAGEYRLVMAATRAEPNVLATRTSVEWTFRSATVPGDRPAPLPVAVVSFAPPLDRDNAAPAGRTVTVPVTVRAQAGGGAWPAVPAVEVSYDDGGHWQAVPVVQGAGGGRVLLRHPDRDGFVSLRARAAGPGGATVRQTVIRAYRIVR
ncbi:serine protease [Sphaerisporangium rufum]|uniref:Serine protease n=1 Tax=Sphaerisporangium rufum TaxID=1381558 RepID=A0A919QVW8_9ACTN|nr:S8 family serine peptidase [Sphaerisporangium rufum]GII75114.1 serine protease [Sphaerisporangium rufum]